MTTNAPRILVLSDKFDESALLRLRKVGTVEMIPHGASAAAPAVQNPVQNPAVPILAVPPNPTNSLNPLDILGSRGVSADSVEAIVVRTGTVITDEFLSRIPNLRVIGRGGVGLDNIDLEACRKRGVQVVYTPAAGTEAVADLAVGLMILILRGLKQGEQAIRTESFEKARRELIGRELSELTVGIVGFGRIGKAFARRCQRGFGMRVVYNDLMDPEIVGFPAEPVEKDELFGRADVVSLHVPLTPLTRGMIDRHALAKFGAHAILLNTARGAVVNTNDLVMALQKGQLAGAGLDVTDPEPLPAGHPLPTMPNVFVTPHLGARTARAQAGMSNVVDDVIRVLKGQVPLYPA